MQYLPDALKLDVIKFLDGPAGKAFTQVLRARCSDAPSATLPHSTKLSMYDQRAGAEFILGEMAKIPHESANSAPDKPASAILLDPRD